VALPSVPAAEPDAGTDATSARRAGSLRDRAIAGVARLLSALFFRSVETVGTVPPSGPVILAASHLNGFVDPVLMVADLRALPRFLAKATLWDTVPARPLLRFARLIPVHRREDAAGAGEVDNRGTFEDAVRALDRGQLLAVFPEGTTHDDPSIRPLRTGVARIALAALEAGLDHVDIVPVGVSYQDKVALRDRAVLAYGDPIRVVAADRPAGEDDQRRAVRALTARLDEGLRRVTPDFASLTDAVALGAAAHIVESVDAAPRRPSQARELARAQRLAGRDRATIDRVVGTVARYHLLLGSIRVGDHDIAAGTGLRSVTRHALGLAVLLVVLAPFAAAGLVANALPALVVIVAGLVPRAPVSKGTVRVLVAVVVFPLTWLAIATWDVGEGPAADLARAATVPIDPVIDLAFNTRGGFWPGLVAFLLLPVLGAAALVLVERSGAFVRDLFVWRTLVDRRGQLDAVRAARAEVVEVTRAASEPS
jgi:1-acyl-sn-glycerol-3-phosphate acyltransferase